ncbi:MAG: branched-chain amino acid ABC transporter permease [Candidatus Latescibacteria bacterium]|nr:branched-chain amino acid ABC transporter permease [Candidatus Latescibacterota bacterium]
MSKYRDLVISYDEDLQLFRTGVKRCWFGVLVVGLAAAPWAGAALGGNYAVYLLNLTGIAVIVALGLNLLIGSTGLVSLGHAAFLAVGAYTAGVLANRLGFPFWMTLTLSGIFTGGIGVIVGLPALRLKGLYLGLATLAFQFVTEHLILHWEGLTGGANGMAVPRPALGEFTFGTDLRFYYLTAPLALLLGLGIANLQRSRFGRALVAIRDSDVAAEAVGVDLARYKTLAFGVSAAYAGVAGSLFAHYLGYIGPDHFTVLLSVEYLTMVIMGGMGSILGSVLGAILATLLPEGLRLAEGALRQSYPSLVFPDLRALVMGLVLILFIVFEPEGLAGLWRRVREYWQEWPFSKR